MKIAIPTRDNVVDDHFGHCEYYTLFTIDDHNEVTGSQFMASPEGCGCKSDIASLLRRMDVTLMLAGNMGGGALNTLNASGIDVIRGCQGDVNQVVKDYLSGKIEDTGEACHAHEGHSCSHRS